MLVPSNAAHHVGARGIRYLCVKNVLKQATSVILVLETSPISRHFQAHATMVQTAITSCTSSVDVLSY